jgi:hypothetical protein
MRACEYVVTDAAQNLIAVVRDIPRGADGRFWPPRSMPPWAEHAPGRVVLALDGVSGLTQESSSNIGSRRERSILIEGNVLIGMIAPGAPHSFLTFRDCTCGRPARKCLCGGRRGRLRYWSRADNAWRIVDAEDHEFARITPRRFTRERGPTRIESTGARLARWARTAHVLFSMGPERVCEVVEVGPGFDWHRDGILVALASEYMRCPRDAAWRDRP